MSYSSRFVQADSNLCKNGGDASDQRASHRIVKEAQLPSLRFRQDRWQRTLSAMPEQASASHALRGREHSGEGCLARRQGAARGRELLRRALPVDPELRRRKKALARSAARSDRDLGELTRTLVIRRLRCELFRAFRDICSAAGSAQRLTPQRAEGGQTVAAGSARPLLPEVGPVELLHQRVLASVFYVAIVQ